MTVDEYLNNVDYSFPDFTPSDDVLKFVNFIRLVNGGETENKTPLVHLVALEEAFRPDGRNTAIMCHRGFAKTSLFAEYLILYIACFGIMPGLGKVNFMLYVGDSIENGVKNLRKNIEYRYYNSEFLQNLIPNMAIKYSDENGEDVDITAGRKFTDVRLEFVNKRGDRLVVRSYGAITGVRGAKEMGIRPQLAIIDDILSDEDARSETVIKTIENTIHKAVKYALSPSRSKMIWLGTPFNAKDPLYKIVESGSWNVACFPICEKFPCSKEEFKGSWEDRFSYEWVKQNYDESIATGQVESFNQELMLRVMNDDDRLVTDDEIIWVKDVAKDILAKKEYYNFYITTDFATSEKKSSDYSVISVWAYNNNGDWILIDGFCGRQTIDKSIEMIFRYVVSYYPIRGVGIEVSGQQGGFISFIRQEMIRKNIYFNLLSSNNNSGQVGIRPIGDKFSRFHLFVPMFKQRKIMFSDKMKETDWGKEFLDEITKAGTKGFKSRHDDILDTISMLGSFEAYKPTSGIPSSNNSSYESLYFGEDWTKYEYQSNSSRSHLTF